MMILLLATCLFPKFTMSHGGCLKKKPMSLWTEDDPESSNSLSKRENMRAERKRDIRLRESSKRLRNTEADRQAQIKVRFTRLDLKI